MRPAKLTRAPEGFEYYRVYDPEEGLPYRQGNTKVQRHIEQIPELIFCKMPLIGAPK